MKPSLLALALAVPCRRAILAPGAVKSQVSARGSSLYRRGYNHRLDVDRCGDRDDQAVVGESGDQRLGGLTCTSNGRDKVGEAWVVRIKGVLDVFTPMTKPTAVGDRWVIESRDLITT